MNRRERRRLFPQEALEMDMKLAAEKFNLDMIRAKNAICEREIREKLRQRDHYLELCELDAYLPEVHGNGTHK